MRSSFFNCFTSSGPRDTRILRRLAWQHYCANDLDRAEAVFLQLLAMTPYEPVNSDLLTALLRRTSRLPEFERVLKAQLARYSSGPQIRPCR